MTILSTAATLSAVTTLVAPATSAAPGCPAGFQCLYSRNLLQVAAIFTSDPDLRDNFFPDGSPVTANTEYVANRSTAGYQAHYYARTNYGVFLFCVNPGSSTTIPPGSQILSIRLRLPTSIACLGAFHDHSAIVARATTR